MLGDPLAVCGDHPTASGDPVWAKATITKVKSFHAFDDRAKLFFKALVERYIADGQPIGSGTLSRVRFTSLIKTATIRNVAGGTRKNWACCGVHIPPQAAFQPRGYRLFCGHDGGSAGVGNACAVGSGGLPPGQRSTPHSFVQPLPQFVPVVMAPRRTLHSAT